jgi:Fe-S-cluster-containing hydrogenase component 2
MPLIFKKSLCTGCKLCQLACSATHEKVFNPDKARIKITHEYTQDGIHVNSCHCTFCKKCEKACPQGAISNDGTHMMVDPDKCIGCATCAEICPTQVIFLGENNTSVICDLCQGDPKCVQWCPKGAISLFIKKKAVA